MTEKNIHRVFVVSLVLKSLNALVETLLGFLLLFSGGIAEIILTLIRNELLEDPNDFFATHFSGLATHLSPGLQLYGAIYLLAHGVVKIFLVWGLIKDRLWAYPASLTVFTLFTIYQVIEIVRLHSAFMFILTIFDLFVIWLVYHEYRYHLKRHHERMERL